MLFPDGWPVVAAILGAACISSSGGRDAAGGQLCEHDGASPVGIALPVLARLAGRNAAAAAPG